MLSPQPPPLLVVCGGGGGAAAAAAAAAACDAYSAYAAYNVVTLPMLEFYIRLEISPSDG